MVRIFVISVVFLVLAAACGGSATATPQYPVGTPVTLMPTAVHVPEGQGVLYSTAPPTSGNHWPGWIQCGFYTEEAPDEFIVHNMEHGNVIISYNLSDPGEITRLRQLVGTLPNDDKYGVTRPYSRIPPGTVAMTAWGVMDLAQSVDEEPIRAFFEAYAGNRFSQEAAAAGPLPC